MKQRFTKGIIATTLAFCSVFGTFGIVTKPDSKASISASASSKSKSEFGNYSTTCRTVIINGKTYSGTIRLKLVTVNKVSHLKIWINGEFFKEFNDPNLQVVH